MVHGDLKGVAADTTETVDGDFITHGFSFTLLI
jgi:hypothetical protein